MSFVLLFSVAATAESNIAETLHADWHAPTTVSERALDGMVKQAETDDHLIDNLLGGRNKATFHRTVDYTTMLTRPLLAAIARAEKAAVWIDPTCFPISLPPEGPLPRSGFVHRPGPAIRWRGLNVREVEPGGLGRGAWLGWQGPLTPTPRP